MKNIKKEMKKLQKEITLEEQKYFAFHKKRYNDILQSIRIKKDMKVLDLGCSSGHLLIILKRLGADVYGVDYINPWKKRFKNHQIKFKKCNIETQKLPFKSETFDYVLMSEVIEHLIKDIHLPIQESKRVLKKGGKFLISTPNACELGKRLLFLAGENIYWDLNTFYERGIYDRHNKEFNMKELVSIIKKNGFRKCKRKYLASWEGLREIEKNNPLAKIVSEFQKLIPQFRSNLLIIAKNEENNC